MKYVLCVLALLLVATGCRKQEDPVYLVTNPGNTSLTPSGQEATSTSHRSS